MGAYPFSAKKKKIRYDFGTGRVRVQYEVKPNGVVLGLKLQPYLASQPLDSYLLQPDSLSSALCLSLPPPPVSSTFLCSLSLSLLSVFSPLLFVSVSVSAHLRALYRRSFRSTKQFCTAGRESLSLTFSFYSFSFLIPIWRTCSFLDWFGWWNLGKVWFLCYFILLEFYFILNTYCIYSFECWFVI